VDLTGLPTPALVVDAGRLRRNAARMTERAQALGVRLRPHVKTHKCVEIARLQTGGHDRALTVSTLAEAAAFAAHGFRDVIYAVPIEPGKFKAALDLRAGGVDLRVVTDDADVAGALDDAARARGLSVDVFVKVDCGYHRCGVDPAGRAALEIPRRLAASRGLRFAGLLTHAGHAYRAATRDQRLAIAREERDVMVRLAARLRDAGIEVPVVSIGSTPTATCVDALDGVDEIRPGNYVLFDAFQATLGTCGWGDCALTVLSAVVARDRGRRQLVLDAGALALSKDQGAAWLDADAGYGRVLDLEGRDLGLHVTAVSQEHGVVSAHEDEVARIDRLPAGARVRILANHSCLTAAQHDWFHVLDGDRIVDRWRIHRGW